MITNVGLLCLFRARYDMHSKVCHPIVGHLESTVRVVMGMDHLKKAEEAPQTTPTFDALTQFAHVPPNIISVLLLL